MPYDHYTVHDFVLDDYFNRWVKAPDDHTDAFWQAWLAQHPHQKVVVAEARQLIQSLSVTSESHLSEPDKKQMWQRIQQRRMAHAQATEAQTVSRPHRLAAYWRYARQIAAAAGILLVLSVLWLWLNPNRQQLQYATAFGEVKEIILPDGSRVSLNANSTLQLTRDWDGNRVREVTLTGEAFFAVAKKAGKGPVKFMVYTPELAVQVVGTQFNVNARHGKAQVVLQEGEVRLDLAASASKVAMAPGDLVEYSRKERHLRRKKVNPAVYASWRRTEMLFEEQPLQEIAQRLEDTQGVQVIFKDEPLRQLQFTGAWVRRDLAGFLQVLSRTFGIRVTRHANQIIIQKQ